ncbi:MAG TPA: dTMP kinase [Bryobacteraceae bacterium]|nr:dTMP kinase [Bryobacteraceae bacterium]
MAKRGIFITFEGMDGCGKTTQMRQLARRLRDAGREVVETVEPGGTAIGSQIRAILLDSANRELASATEVLLYFAARAQNVEQVIRPALAERKIVLSDRFTDSSLAYQGCGRGLGADTVLDLHRIACGGLRPDLTLLIEIDLDTSLARARARNRQGNRTDRMEEQEAAFYNRVRDAYSALAKAEPERFRVIDGRAGIGQVTEEVWKAVAPHV